MELNSAEVPDNLLVPKKAVNEAMVISDYCLRSCENGSASANKIEESPQAETLRKVQRINSLQGQESPLQTLLEGRCLSLFLP